ncbi:MAG: KamA family protein [Bacteroidales bacterium]|nr:KamA family protein [Bacteroidales bacterium]MDD4673752.1 KamA family protein [Bacteroidales bacterium]MDY0348953.1 KamA family protein [Tenuifilaceae bacterium]
MTYYPEKIALSAKSLSLLRKLMLENPRLADIYNTSTSLDEAKAGVKKWAYEVLNENPLAVSYYKGEAKGRLTFESLRWQDFAAVRILDYLDNSGRKFENPYREGRKSLSIPFELLWLGVKQGKGGAKPLFFKDMIHLFRQLNNQLPQEKPTADKVNEWMERWHEGLDPQIVEIRKENKERIIRILARNIESCELGETRYCFSEDLTEEQKLEKMREWWNDYRFHLKFAVRSPRLLNELLDYTLDLETQKLLSRAEKKGIPFFVNPYYLSLLNTRVPDFDVGSDLAIRHYVIYSKPLIDQFGNIQAWEKEDQVEPGKPNAAGWLLPSHHSVHRRYPEVAILIPDTMGRACGGLCVSCQRMYDFQRGNLNFNLDKLKPNETWDEKLERLLKYWEEDPQLRDILITGGDALMSQNKSLKKILDAVLDMAIRKIEANKSRPDGEKFAEIQRIRLGSRLLAYLPQRITPDLIQVLGDFKQKASVYGIKQFIIQTHFESPMEVTPESALAVSRLVSIGWTVTNQLVFTSAASRRGHTAKLRKVLNDIGVITYYTFSVKGFQENMFNYATNARAVQEQIEEKVFGQIPVEYLEQIRKFPMEAEQMVENLKSLREKANIPFMASDRNVINLPGVGKSLTFRTIGITRWGRRILEFDYDHTRWHSPIINQNSKVVIIESKPIGEYINQLEDMGEDTKDYKSVWGYSIGETESRLSVFDYPDYEFNITDELANLEI